MKPPMAVLYRWRNGRLEFIERRESQMPRKLNGGWRLLAKDSDLTQPVPDHETGEQQHD